MDTDPGSSRIFVSLDVVSRGGRSDKGEAVE